MVQTLPETTARIQSEIEHAHEVIPQVERQVRQSTESGTAIIRHRLSRVHVMEHALERNMEAAEAQPDRVTDEDLAKLERLRLAVEMEVAELEWETTSLTQGGKHTLESTFEVAEGALKKIHEIMSTLGTAVRSSKTPSGAEKGS